MINVLVQILRNGEFSKLKRTKICQLIYSRKAIATLNLGLGFKYCLNYEQQPFNILQKKTKTSRQTIPEDNEPTQILLNCNLFSYINNLFT